MSRPVLLIELGGELPQADFATFDATTIGPSLELELSSLVVVPIATSNNQRNARSTLGKSTGRWYVEATFYGQDDLDTLPVAVGVLPAAASASEDVGKAAGSVGYRPGTGVIRAADSTVETVQVAVAGDVIGIDFDLDSSPRVVTFYVNGARVSSDIPLTDPGVYRVAMTVGGAAEGIRGFINFGQRSFERPVAGANLGLYDQSAAPAVARFASETFITDTTDTPASTTYFGRLSESFDTYTERGATFWPWGQSGGTNSIGDVEVINNDGALDGLLNGYRDQPIRMLRVLQGQAYASAVEFASGIVSQVDAVGENRLSIKVRSKVDRLSVPLQRRLFLPSTSENAANTPWPVLLGTARNIPAILYDQPNLALAVSDRPVQSVVVVRDQADPLDPSGSPSDWFYTPDQSGFFLEFDPFGKITADASSTGGSGSDPTPDALAGVGNPFVWGSTLVGWGDVTYATVDEPAGGGLRIVGDWPSSSWAAVLNALTIGQSYRWRATVTRYEYTPPLGFNAGFLITYGPLITPVYGQISGVGEATGTFIATTDDIYIAVNNSDNAPKLIEITSFTVEPTQAVDPASLDDPIVGINLADYAQEIIENRAELLSSDWDRPSAEAIGTYDLGAWFGTPTTCLQALDTVIDSHTAAFFEDRLGKIKFFRLLDPDNDESPPSAAVFDFTENDIIGDLEVKVDRGVGLSNQMACRRNWSVFTEGEFVTDYVAVPVNLRRRFSREYQFTRQSSTNLASVYRHATQANPVPSAIDDPNDAQFEIDRISALYATERRDYTFTVGANNGEFEIEPGDIVTMTIARFGLDSGKRLLVYKVRASFFGNTVTINAWG